MAILSVEIEAMVWFLSLGCYLLWSDLCSEVLAGGCDLWLRGWVQRFILVGRRFCFVENGQGFADGQFLWALGSDLIVVTVTAGVGWPFWRGRCVQKVHVSWATLLNGLKRPRFSWCSWWAQRLSYNLHSIWSDRRCYDLLLFFGATAVLEGDKQ